MNNYKKEYRYSKGNAKRRGILWYLSYEEWLDIWQRSGKLAQRGCRKGQYVMARKGDVGPYEADNVEIIRAEDNHRDAFKNGRHNGMNVGEKNGNAKITEHDVLAIRKDTDAQHIIAAKYGIARNTVSHIKTKMRWKHVA